MLLLIPLHSWRGRVAQNPTWRSDQKLRDPISALIGHEAFPLPPSVLPKLTFPAMQTVLRALTRQPPADLLLYIVVAQYQRYSYGLGQENRYHWAIAVLSDLEKSTKEQCRCY